MRVVIVGRDVNPQSKLYTLILQEDRPHWETVNMGDISHTRFIEELPSITGDCIVLADQHDVIGGYLAQPEPTIPILIPYIAVFSYWTPQAAYRLRCNSIYPMASPFAFEELPVIIETQTLILCAELASPNRAMLAREAAKEMFPSQKPSST